MDRLVKKYTFMDNKKSVQVECSYCEGYQKQILVDDDLANIESGTITDFHIKCSVSKMERRICNKCIRLCNLENKIIMLCDHLLDSDYAKSQRINLIK